MEKDDEVKGAGNSYDFGARIHDPRIGRFLSIDPAAQNHPFFSPYLFAFNKPIMMIDLYGLRGWPTTQKWGITDLERFGQFTHSYVQTIRAKALEYGLNENSKEACKVRDYPDVCFDCADFAVSMYLSYAVENGKEVEITLVDGQVINSNMTDEIKIGGATISIDTPEDFIKVAKDWSTAYSILDNMNPIDEDEVEIGDLMDNGGHVASISKAEKERGGFPTVQVSGGLSNGVLEGRVPHDSNSSYFGNRSFKRWKTIDESSKHSNEFEFGKEVELDQSQSMNYEW